MTPEPINKHIVCSVCGLDWHRHGEDKTLEKCIELLKSDLAMATNAAAGLPRGFPDPTVVPGVTFRANG